MSGIRTSLPNRIRPDEICPDQTMDAHSTGAPERLADRLGAAATSGIVYNPIFVGELFRPHDSPQ
jgi:hypothetical protein